MASKADGFLPSWSLESGVGPMLIKQVITQIRVKFANAVRALEE